MIIAIFMILVAVGFAICFKNLNDGAEAIKELQACFGIMLKEYLRLSERLEEHKNEENN